jgi:hypothetical protein
LFSLNAGKRWCQTSSNKQQEQVFQPVCWSIVISKIQMFEYQLVKEIDGPRNHQTRASTAWIFRVVYVHD